MYSMVLSTATRVVRSIALVLGDLGAELSGQFRPPGRCRPAPGPTPVVEDCTPASDSSRVTGVTLPEKSGLDLESSLFERCGNLAVLLLALVPGRSPAATARRVIGPPPATGSRHRRPPAGHRRRARRAKRPVRLRHRPGVGGPGSASAASVFRTRPAQHAGLARRNRDGIKLWIPAAEWSSRGAPGCGRRKGPVRSRRTPAPGQRQHTAWVSLRREYGRRPPCSMPGQPVGPGAAQQIDQNRLRLSSMVFRRHVCRQHGGACPGPRRDWALPARTPGGSRSGRAEPAAGTCTTVPRPSTRAGRGRRGPRRRHRRGTASSAKSSAPPPTTASQRRRGPGECTAWAGGRA